MYYVYMYVCVCVHTVLCRYCVMFISDYKAIGIGTIYTLGCVCGGGGGGAHSNSCAIHVQYNNLINT